MDFLCYQAKLGLRKGWMLYAGEGDKVCSHASRVKKIKIKNRMLLPLDSITFDDSLRTCR